ncbi:MAG: ABC transporter permease [Geminicoccaceae bacterium]|nr:ABC transporter permease [Geminicoccaceae bacterium]
MTGGGRIGGFLLWAWTALVLAFLILPLLVVVPISFSSGAFLTFPIPGLSLRWYATLWNEAVWWRATANSLVVGTAATLIATLLGTLAALGLARASFRGKGLLTAVLISPMIVPLIIVAAGTYFFFLRLGIGSGLVGLTLAHAALGAPFVLVTVGATLKSFDANLARAAAGLGAPPATVLRRVTVPLIAPGMVSGALFAFITSFDELVVALFLTGPSERTLPRQMFDGIRENLSPTLLAAATILVLLSVVLLSLAEWLRRRGLKNRGIRA